MKPSSNSEQLGTIASSSKGSQTSLKPVSDPRRSQGQHSETLVREYYLKQGYHLLHQNLKTPFAEVDLIFWDLNPKSPWKIIEVKTIQRASGREQWISQRQRGRLARVCLWLSERGREVELVYALVDEVGAIEIVSE